MRAAHSPHREPILLAFLLLVTSCALRSRAAAFPDWTDCPAVCRCKWTSGKKSALCPDAGLTTLPASLDPDMQVLDLSGNRIPTLEAETFKHADLLNLQRVFMRNAGIRDIDGDAFKDMRILVEIDLSNNHLRNLVAHTFTGNERLKMLVLSGNPLVTLRANQFPVLQHLRNLELRRCSLVQVHPQAFQRLLALETLSLDNNELEYLETETVVGLKRLKTLGLDNNPWSCDCRLREFCRLMTSSALSRLYSVPQTCVQPPRLQGRAWNDVRPTEFACEPTVQLPLSSLQEEISGNVSLACLASGDPEPEVWWQLNGEPLNVTRRAPDELVPPGGLVTYSTSLEARRRLLERWSNLTIYNASDTDAGEYTCHARNVAGTAHGSISVSIPRVFTAPTLSKTDHWLLWLSLLGGGAVALCVSASAVLLAICLCGSARKRNRSAKVKLQSSTSFGDQEKKLLDLSITTTATSGARGQQRVQQPNRPDASGPRVQPESELELEPRLRPSHASVTVERLSLQPEPSLLRPGRCLSPVLPASIFIAVSLASREQVPTAEIHERCYPDLLDIGLSSFSTLPRRTAGRRELGSPYDNMGPRVTATGSSTFSLVEHPESQAKSQQQQHHHHLATSQQQSQQQQQRQQRQLGIFAPLVQPPPEFVSL